MVNLQDTDDDDDDDSLYNVGTGPDLSPEEHARRLEQFEIQRWARIGQLRARLVVSIYLCLRCARLLTML
jgi:hypothetical protein